MTRAAALGFDVGTSAVKAGLLWLEGDEPMVTAAHAYPSSRPRPGWVEQDPRAWLTAMAACWADLRAQVGEVELRSVGICGQVNTHLAVDADLVPLGPAITWQDVRAAEVAARLDALVADRRETIWGGPFTVDASFALSRLEWLAQHEPGQRRAARWLLQPRDYCVAALTGEAVSDPLSQVGLVGGDGRYLGAALELVEGAGSVLPPLRELDAPAGTTSETNPVGLPGGIPVAAGTMDAWGSLLGAGLFHPGRAMDLAGTSEVVAVSATSTTPTPGIISFPPFRGVHVHAGPTQAGGAALEWVADLLSRSVADALALAERAALDPQSLIFLPHLAGERAPYWNPDARGVFVGLTTATADGHLVLAVLEGVAHMVRLLLAAAEQAAGLEVPVLRICGGGARSALWNQLKADAIGQPVEVLATTDAGVLGAIFSGMVAGGLAHDLGELAEERVRVASTLEPRPAAAARLEELHGVFVESYRALEPLFGRMT